jgi:diguanylate cyclase (GGDEF)-like protein
MMKPPIPSDETQRLRSLQSLRILDTNGEERFDRITRLAARLFGVPIALVSLVDQDRQWFKSKVGLDACETGRDISFCGHAILSEGPLVVTDAHRDPRFADNPLVTDAPAIRFYAGQPIHAPDGARIGTLCLIDHAPREFPEADRAQLADLAAMIDRELSLQSLAAVDPLTHLSNRRGFHQLAVHVLALCRRAGTPAVLAAIDLDGFKAINDVHGHDAGDHVLQAFGSLLLRHFRTSDVVGRMGGDEFCVLAGGATESQMRSSLDRFTAAYAGSALARAYPRLSWSAGVVEFDPKSGPDVDALISAADKRMYAVKETSRNRVATGR